MYCQYCGNQLDDDSVFCKHCGEMIKKEDKTDIKSLKPQASQVIKKKDIPTDEDYIEITIPGRSKDVLKFAHNSISYKEKVLRYNEIKDISCQMESLSVNHLPTKHSFFFVFSGTNANIKIFFNASFIIKLNEKKEVFSKIFAVSKKIVVPIIVTNLVNRIMNEDETIKIGPVFFNKNGYYTKNLFRKECWIYWKDKKIKPVMEQGRYFLIKEENNRFKYFAEIPLVNPNGIVIPELLESLYSIYQK